MVYKDKNSEDKGNGGYDYCHAGEQWAVRELFVVPHCPFLDFQQ